MSQRSCVAFTAVALLVLNAHAFHAFSSLCLSTPPLPLVAGVSNISAIYDVSYWQQCRAFLSFAAEDFPTVTFTFGPKYCMGREVASFLVPAEVPNGDAHLIWECSGLPNTCIQASITQGKGNSSMPLDQIGSVRCESVCLPSNTSDLSSVAPASSIPPGLAPSVTSMVSSTDGPPAIPNSTSSSTTIDVSPVASNGSPPSDATWASTPTQAGTTPSASNNERPGEGSSILTASTATALSQDGAVSRTSSTDPNASNRGGIAGFPSVSSAARLTPGLSFTVLTLTQTVTTLLTATTTLPGM